MNSSTDSNEVKAEITDILSGGGLKIDPSSFIEYICGTQADVPTKIQFIKKMNANGSQLRSDAASTYLERTAPNQFSSELFSLIFTPASSFSAKAVERYLLYCRDREAIKAQNFRTIAERCSGGIGTMTCQVSHAGDTQDLEFEQMMEQRIRDNFTAPATDGVQISDERLKEMSKKLPEWSLEPPYSFLK